MSRSSKRWVAEHARDPFVRGARKEQYRSRASYKLLQIQEKFGLLRPGDRVLDLGAAPGGWSQAAARIVGHRGEVLAVDLLKMEGIPGVRVLQGDFRDPGTQERIAGVLGRRKADVVVSDMAPNTSGTAVLDQGRSLLLAESVFEALPGLLRAGGGAAIKVFQGKDFPALTARARALFGRVRVFKPEASRSRSAEVYLVCRDYRGVG